LKKDVINDQVKLDPTGKYIAWVSNQSGLVKVWVHDNTKTKRERFISKGIGWMRKMTLHIP
jgi:hypothetical protein